MENKRGIISDYLPWLIIMIVVLVLFMIGAFTLKEKGFEFIDKVLGLFKRR